MSDYDPEYVNDMLSENYRQCGVCDAINRREARECYDCGAEMEETD